MSDFFVIEFQRIGFPYEANPIGDLVSIQWEGQHVAGRIWSGSYSPKQGYYRIGVRLEPKTLPDAALAKIWEWK